MSQTSSDKYIYFTVGVLKGSDALDALRADAVKHHMIDYPGQLIALRLTEYYEMMNQGITQPVIKVPTITTPVEQEQARQREQPASSPATAAYTPSASASASAASSTIEISAPVSFQQTGDSRPMSMNQMTGRMRAITRDGDTIISTSNNADQNADEAADYWSML